MGSWERGVWEWKWQWRRQLFDREKLLINNLKELIANYQLKESETDSWRWRQSRSGTYITKEVYDMLAPKINVANPGRPSKTTCNLLWKSIALCKAMTIAWRLVWSGK